MRRTPDVAIAIAAFLICAALFSLPGSADAATTGRLKGEAACYNRRYIGHRTASGQRYDPDALTASHGTIRVGTHVKVTNLENGKSVVVVINDKMSAHGKIIMDVSQRACDELAFGPGGKAKVKVEVEPSEAESK